MNIRNPRASYVLCTVLSCAAAYAQHQDLFIGHSPPDMTVQPTPKDPCPTTEPRMLFIANNASVGGAIPPNGGDPADSGGVIRVTHVAITAPLARPEFGGFVYGAGQPGFNFIDPDHPCHGMSVVHAGGTFLVALERRVFPDAVNLAMADHFGVPILGENSSSWTLGGSTAGGHVHPLFLAYRPGKYLGEFRVTSDRFIASDPFTLRFATETHCGQPVPLDISSAFNADVVDSDITDTPLAFDPIGRYWVRNGHYSTTRGLPEDGALDVFRLGGLDGSGLSGSNLNCLVDDGIRSTLGTIDLAEEDEHGIYVSMELLLAAAGAGGAYTSSDRLVVTLDYVDGSIQVINVRQAAVSPLYFPIRDWRINTSPLPNLAVGRGGDRNSRGFVRSTGSAIDFGVSPEDSFYFSRVVFPLDPNRVLQRISFGDYIGRGRLGVFAVTAFRSERCRDYDLDTDDDVDCDDMLGFAECMTGPGQTYQDEPCSAFDGDRSQTVDLHDFSGMQDVFSGER